MPARKKPAGTQQDRRPGRALSLMPTATVDEPPMPTGLLEESEQKWRDYWDSAVSGVAPKTAHAVVERWIFAYDEWVRALAAVRQCRIVEGSTGQPVLNPLAAYAASREATMQKCELELGLTPMAQLKLGITVGQAKITAAELNRMAEEGDDGNADVIDADEAELLEEFEAG